MSFKRGILFSKQFVPLIELCVFIYLTPQINLKVPPSTINKVTPRIIPTRIAERILLENRDITNLLSLIALTLGVEMGGGGSSVEMEGDQGVEEDGGEDGEGYRLRCANPGRTFISHPEKASRNKSILLYEKIK